MSDPRAATDQPNKPPEGLGLGMVSTDWAHTGPTAIAAMMKKIAGRHGKLRMASFPPVLVMLVN
jgi:hypothetical protein